MELRSLNQPEEVIMLLIIFDTHAASSSTWSGRDLGSGQRNFGGGFGGGSVGRVPLEV